MWSRYFSKALRPAGASVYSVRGIRPSKLLLHRMYLASSSLRAWTLKFPSVVLSNFFRSLKVSDELAARALIIPKRMRSWIKRSKSGIASPGASRFTAAGGGQQRPAFKLPRNHMPWRPETRIARGIRVSQPNRHDACARP